MLNLKELTETESTYTPARWLALERACHRLRSLVFVRVSFIHCSSSRSGKVFVSFAPRHCAGPMQPGTCSSRASSSRWDLCSTRSFIVHAIHDLALPHTDLPSWRLVLELLLREDVSHSKALHLRTLLFFDVLFVRLVFFSVFHSLLVLPVNFISMFVSILRLGFSLPSAVPKSPCAPQDSLDFVSAWAWFWHSSPLYTLTHVHLDGHWHIHGCPMSAWCCSQ